VFCVQLIDPDGASNAVSSLDPTGSCRPAQDGDSEPQSNSIRSTESAQLSRTKSADLLGRVGLAFLRASILRRAARVFTRNLAFRPLTLQKLIPYPGNLLLAFLRRAARAPGQNFFLACTPAPQGRSETISRISLRRNRVQDGCLANVCLLLARSHSPAGSFTPLVVAASKRGGCCRGGS
jgi:hypothetical protein